MNLGAQALAFLLESLLKVLLPPLCPLCRQRPPAELDPFCPACGRGLQPLEEPFCSACAAPFSGVGPCHPCPRCAEDPPRFRELRAFGLYRGALLEAIHSFKYGKNLSVRRALEELLLRGYDRFWGAGMGFSTVVPVPCRPQSLRRRGFDLPALLARRIAREKGIPWRPLALAVVREIPDLVGLGAKDRTRAVAGAFAPREALRGEVLLVDDVATSTATARACTGACLEAGAAEVRVLVLARTPLEVR